MFFSTSSWRFLRSNKLEQLEFKLEKILGFRNMHEKLEKRGFKKKFDLNAGSEILNLMLSNKITLDVLHL